MSSRHLYPLDPVFLLKSLLMEEDVGPVPTVSTRLRFSPAANDPFRVNKYGKMLETPLGVAAGPHTQMSQNIVTAWQAGARFIELKTVQVLDEIDVAKPCIDMRDEGYNCEWSQELKLEQSYREYLVAWVLIHVFRHKWGFNAGGDEPGFLFNMSAGYDLAGIQSAPMQTFFKRMGDAASDIEELRELLAPVYPAIRDIPISPVISDSLTVSTMHGCPPDEIERIGRYFLEEKKFHTSIKLNPTLLGPETLRGILNEQLGYQVNVPDEAFEHDLKWEDALGLIRNLREAAKAAGREFGLKLTNTLECLNSGEALPASEKMLYMSGRALHPLAIALAAKLQKAFDGELDISFSAGIAAENVADSLACGLGPLTVCSDLLKPGGYTRLYAMLHELKQAAGKIGALSPEELVCKVAGLREISEARLRNLRVYAEKCASSTGPFTKKSRVQARPLKRELPRYDCTVAPCHEVCPTGQFQPDYLGQYRVGNGREARLALLLGNPMHHMQAAYCDTICKHKCEKYCFRNNADFPLRIQAVRALIQMESPPVAPLLTDGRGAIIRGDGLAGMVCAFWLSRAGLPVVVEDSLTEVKIARKEAFGDTLWNALGLDYHALQHRGVTFVPSPVNYYDEMPEGLAVYVTADAVTYPPGKGAPEDRDDILRLTGTAATTGLGSITEAVREGARIAGEILTHYNLPLPILPPREAQVAFGHRKGKTTSRGPISIFTAGQARVEASLCLQCDLVCGVCVNVCPNRANFSQWSPTTPVPVPVLALENGKTVLRTEGELHCREITQILHLADLCNECGNCATFCPSSGAPYKTKTRLYRSLQAFEAADMGYYLESRSSLRYKEQGLISTLALENGVLVYEDDNARMEFDPATMSATTAVLKPGVDSIVMDRAAECLLAFQLTEDIRSIV